LKIENLVFVSKTIIMNYDTDYDDSDDDEDQFDFSSGKDKLEQCPTPVDSKKELILKQISQTVTKLKLNM
jgi:hypothetical protein